MVCQREHSGHPARRRQGTRAVRAAAGRRGPRTRRPLRRPRRARARRPRGRDRAAGRRESRRGDGGGRLDARRAERGAAGGDPGVRHLPRSGAPGRGGRRPHASLPARVGVLRRRARTGRSRGRLCWAACRRSSGSSRRTTSGSTCRPARSRWRARPTRFRPSVSARRRGACSSIPSRRSRCSTAGRRRSVTSCRRTASTPRRQGASAGATCPSGASAPPSMARRLRGGV